MRVKQYGILLASKPVIELIESLIKNTETKLEYSKTIEDYAKLIVLFDYLPENTESEKYKIFKYKNDFFILRKDRKNNITFFKTNEIPTKYNEIRLEPKK